MEHDLDRTRCYHALLSRDPRFDGRFFIGVLTTGIYCRPICPARPPKSVNVHFFACSAAAEAAGFRPCLRCRPESSPGTPAWLGSSAIVSRALRLINAGALDAAGVDELAPRLGVGSRQLRRLFAAHLGASPIAIATARRVHFARRLLDETDLPMSEVALAAGFSSIRQFNCAVRATFRRSPTELRRGRTGVAKRPVSSDRALVVRLAYRSPLDWRAMLDFLAPRATPGIEAIDGDTYRRTIEVGGAAGSIEVRPRSGANDLGLTVRLPSYDGLREVVERARRAFDLGADPLEIVRHLSRSPALEPIVEASCGRRVPGAWDPFELAVRAILGQQVTVRGATTLAGRLVVSFGRKVDAGPDLTHLFPRPEALADGDLARIGIPQARAATIRTLARWIAAGDLALDASLGLEEAVARLCAIPGLGAWTAHYIAMRALGEPDAFPASDLGLRRALSHDGRLISADDLTRTAEAWRPWRAYAAIALWAALDRERARASGPAIPRKATVGITPTTSSRTPCRIIAASGIHLEP